MKARHDRLDLCYGFKVIINYYYLIDSQHIAVIYNSLIQHCAFFRNLRRRIRQIVYSFWNFCKRAEILGYIPIYRFYRIARAIRVRSLTQQVDLTYAVAVDGKTGAFGMAQHIIISVGFQSAYLVCAPCSHSLLFVNAGLRRGKQSRVLYLFCRICDCTCFRSKYRLISRIIYIYIIWAKRHGSAQERYVVILVL